MSDINRLHETPIMHRIVEHGGVLYFGGITASDKSQDIVGQTAQVCARLKELLGSAGSDASRLLTVTVYLADFSTKDGMNEAWAAAFEDSELPARATLGVADLGQGTLIEVVATAAA